MALAKSPGRKPLPTPKGQRAQLPIYGNRSWNYDGLSDLPSPFNTGWPEGYVPDEIRRQMLTHPKISQFTNNLKAAILGDGGRVVPCVGPTHPKWELARDLAQLCRFALRQMKGSWHGTARQLLDGVHECHKVAAKAFREQESGEFSGYWLLDTLQLLPNHTYRFLRDASGQVPKLKVRVVRPRGERALEPAPGFDGWEECDREQFAVFTFRPIDGSIWGTTAYAAAYEPFYSDVQLPPVEMSMLAQFGTPSIVVIAPGRDNDGLYPPDLPVYQADGVTPLLDENGEQVKIAVTEDIARKLENFELGSLIVLPGGSIFQLVEAQNGGEAFSRSHESNWRQMASAIVGTDQLTESRNQLSSDNKGVAQDVAGLGILDGKRALEEMVENDIFIDIVRYNYGDAALDLLPIFDLGSGQNARLVALMNSVAAYVSNGAFDESQWWDYCVAVSLPLPDPDAKKLVASTESRGSGGAQGNKSEDVAEE